jgi:hypothetical protein
MNNCNKYNNWTAVTESDFLSLFIKTWFAFIATLRDLHPEAYNRVGDKRSLVAYLNMYNEIYSKEINFTSELCENIEYVYTKGKDIILNQYPEYYFADFFEVNPQFKYKDKIDSANLVINARKESKNVLSLMLIGIDEKYRNYFGKPIRVEVDFNSIIYNSSNINTDERIFLSAITAAIMKELEDKLYLKLQVLRDGIPDKRKTVDQYINFIYQAATGHLRSRMNVGTKTEGEKTPNEKGYNEDSFMLIKQCPENFFLLYSEMERTGTAVFNESDPSEVLRKRKRQKNVQVNSVIWFIKFVYRLRNALFHEIIDPLDPIWQDIFKMSYLVLKEVVDTNIKILNRHQDAVLEEVAIMYYL